MRNYFVRVLDNQSGEHEFTMLKLSYCIHSKVERRFQVRDCPQSLRIRQDQSVYETSPFPMTYSLPVNASNPILSSQRITLSSKKTNMLCRYVR